jgi:putative ABC transport system permease protein
MRNRLRTLIAALHPGLRDAVRALRRSPAGTILSIATLGAGIGASTLVFALVNATLLRPLPYPAPDRLVRVFEASVEAGVNRGGAASGNIDDWRRRTTRFDGIAGYYATGRTISRSDGAEVAVGAQVSADFFAVMGVPPLLGRTFTAAETDAAVFTSAAAPAGADPVTVLSHGLWQRRFGGDAGILGRVITVERREFRVVGIMPPGFDAPDDRVQLWIPWNVSRGPRDQRYLGVVARLKPGVALVDAEIELNRVAEELGREHPDSNRGWSVRLASLRSETVGDAPRVLRALMGGVALVLLVTCATVALLTIVRGLDRANDIAIRLVLGASPGRIVGEQLTESILVAALGGLLGASLAAAGVRFLPAWTADLPRAHAAAIDGAALTFTVAITMLSAVLGGLPHVWRHLRLGDAARLASAARATADTRRHRLRDAIIVGQLAMAVALTAGGGLLVRSVVHLRAVDPGYDPHGVLVAPVFLDSQKYRTGEHARSYYQALFERVQDIPGVMAVGGGTTVPTSPHGPDFERPVWRDGASPDAAERLPASVRIVTPGYFAALRLRIAAGRAFGETDSPTSPRVVMVNESLARRLWPEGAAVGQHLVVDYSTAGTYPYEVVGVVGDVRFAGPRTPSRPEVFFPHAQRSYLIMNVVIRSAGDPRAIAPAVRQALIDIDPQKPAHGLYPLDDLLRSTYARDRQATIAMVVFAVAATALAVLSIYAALSERVRERSREIAIRMAMGATAGRVFAWVASAGLRLIAAGLVTGVGVTWALARTLDALLFGVAGTDVPTTLAVVTLVTIVGLAATVIPAWHAARIDPIETLRR